MPFRIILVLMAALFGAAAGTVALLGVATITARPRLFLLAGLAAFCAAYLLGMLLATLGVSSLNKRRVRMALFCAMDHYAEAKTEVIEGIIARAAAARTARDP